MDSDERGLLLSRTRRWASRLVRQGTHLVHRSLRHPQAGLNVIIIGIDTLRADHLGCYGYERPTSPHIDRFAKECRHFTQAFSTSSWTTPAWMSLFTSLLPSRHGVIQYPQPGQLPFSIPTLAESLRQHGYVTAGFHGGGYVSEAFGFDRGFHRYETRGTRFGDSLAVCLEWLRKHRRWRFFLFWHGFDCHRPYDPPAEFDVFYPEYGGHYDVTTLYMEDGNLPQTQEDVDYIVAKYDGEIRYVDFLVGQVLAELEELQLLEETVVIITSDHGEEFLEHGCFDHTRTLYDELIHVPLLIHTPPRLSSPAVEDALLSLVDVGPLIASWLGFPFPSRNAMVPGLDRRCVFAATGYRRKYLEETEGRPWQHKKNRPELLRCIRTPRWKLLLDREDRPIELYDVRGDPSEDWTLNPMPGKVVHELLGAFREAEEPLDVLKLSLDEPDDVDQQVLERLRGLGYL